MLKKNDKVIYRDCGMLLEGKVLSDPYILVKEERKYVDVYFKSEDLYIPIQVDLLDKVE